MYKTNKKRSHYEAHISNDVTALFEKIMSVKLLAIFIKDFKRYPNAYCLLHGRYFSCINFLKFEENKHKFHNKVNHSHCTLLHHLLSLLAVYP